MTTDEKIVGAVLTLLTSDKRNICVDDATSQHSLAIFREMARAPRASRQQLYWYLPQGLWPQPAKVINSFSQMKAEGRDVRLAEPRTKENALPGLDQMMLNGAALRLSQSLSPAERSVDIRSAWLPAGSSARWWPLNRVNASCVPRFRISNPVRNSEIAFVAVQAEHWGTLYALEPVNGNWRPFAEWSRWLY
ncbi:hypothetical protein KFK14_22280 [Sphingobium phenoxybenzoativorans]|uniref:Uncharacterized protein n=1 Tax=Sphingobium phenoxybenzoativorans TaxID=1592790 RepID=A0A975K6F7_9SPHN|nr:hypothetical protein [Sphingobium phenoxybenzoativorans]QUT05645.1 hypothetical protein KFK14_22280 [Sphingobium phenoxybenzoativorans]